MAYKRPPFPMHEGTSPHKSALKDIVRGIGPHNPAHRAIGDESDAAHDTPEFQKAGDAYQAEQQKKAEARKEKEAANPNKDKIDALRAELRNINEFLEPDKYDAILAEIKKLRAE